MNLTYVSKVVHDKKFLGGTKFQLSNFQGQGVFVEQDVDSVEVDELVEMHGFAKVTDRIAASLIIVKDPAKLGQRTSWAAAIKGSFVITPATLRDSGQLTNYY